MKFLIAEAHPLAGGAASFAALAESDFILRQISAAVSRRPRPMAANSVVTRLGTPRL